MPLLIQVSELQQNQVSLEASATGNAETAELMQQTVAELGSTIEAAHARLDGVHQELLQKLVSCSCRAQGLEH